MGDVISRTRKPRRRGRASGLASAALAILVLGAMLCALPGAAFAQLSFTKSILNGATPFRPTSLQFGPDGRLYVLLQSGTIKIYEITRNAADDYEVVSTETIDSVKTIPNHDDDGTVNASVSKRQATGILVVGTAQAPVLYVSSSDERQGGGPEFNDQNVDTNSGIISRLTFNGSGWDKVDLVRGLPRSEENHATNGMQLDVANNVLYVAQGGHTNMGAASVGFVNTPEYALSAAILTIDLDAIGDTTYDLPTLDDEDRPGNPDQNDPFGGNDGKNQAILDPFGPVQVYSPGYRNPYDIVLTTQGRLYTVDNGPNAGWGGFPIGEGTAACTNAINETGSATYGDGLHFIASPGYYGGHPNPTRANPANTFNPTNPQSPVSGGNPVECDYQEAGVDNDTLTVWSNSTNGIAEYTANSFGGLMVGDLIVASYDNKIWRVKLDAEGDDATLVEPLFSSVTTAKPLDVTAQGTLDVFPGTIWVVTYAEAGAITVFEPATPPNCTGANDPGLDEDADCYDNADEITNATDPCSAADVPEDWDADCESDVTDDDDDDDTIPDTSDPFALDPDNGTTTSVPVSYTWENGLPSPGGFFGTGFTGLMTNGIADYLTLFNPDAITFTGGSGKLTVDSIPGGDALGASNDQEFGFQFGVDALGAPDIFTARTQLVAPFLGIVPEDFQSFGLTVGDGTQDDYVKIVAAADGGGGGIEMLSEVSGTATPGDLVSLPLPGPDSVDLYLTVDRLAATVQGAYSVTTGGVPGAVHPVGSPVSIPPAWLVNAASGLAVGLISTSRGTAPAFSGTWELIEVFPGAVLCTSNADCDDASECTQDVCLAGECLFAPVADGTACNDLATCTNPDACTAGVCVGADLCPPGQDCDVAASMCVVASCTADADCGPGEVCTAGTCRGPDGDIDNDGLLAATDPCPLDPRNLCAGPVATDGATGNAIRLNAAVSANPWAGQKTDCNGDVWLADFGYNDASGAAFCNAPGGCPIAGLDAVFGCSDEATADLFRSEHWDHGGGEDLLYSFDVADGRYVVNLLFANTYDGTAAPGSRVFDITIEGDVVYDDFDQVVVAGGSSETAVVRSAIIDVADGDGLQIELGHEVQNPAIKAIEVLVDFDLTGTGTQPHLTFDILDSGSCRSCHGDYDSSAHNEPWPTWAGSMMAQAGRDPLFWAALDVANNDVPGVGEWCLRCHAPKAWLAGRMQPPAGGADGCGMLGNIDESDNDFDGLDCQFCHRMVINDSPPPGEESVYLDNGQFWIDDTDCDGKGEPCRRGPYGYPEDGAVAPRHAWLQSDYHEQSEICGNCHNVTNPIITLISGGIDTGIPFPVERTYAEWLASDFSSTGASHQTCQNCHMPDATSDPAFACDDFDNNHTGDMPIHEFAGGNTWIPEVLRLTYPNLAIDSSLIASRDAAFNLLENLSATIDVDVPPSFTPGGAIGATVTVTNLSGHKLPTGYPEGRRMWLEVTARDGNDAVIWQSGAYDSETAVLTKDPQIKVYEIKHGIWDLNGTGECDTDSEGEEIFHFVRNNCIAKDNRIPPLGFTGGSDPEIAPVDHVYPETSPGSGVLVNYDISAYTIPVAADVVAPVSVTAILRYQTTSKDYIDFLVGQADDNAFPNDCIDRTSGPPTQHRAGILFDMWNDHGKSAPVDMVSAAMASAVSCVVMPDLCTGEEVCNPTTGVCESSPDCTIDEDCEDGDVCTGADTCEAGFCVSEFPACGGGLSCNPHTVTCGIPDGCTLDAECANGVVCDGNETCANGFCGDGAVPGAGAPCEDDANVCTDDVCDGAGLCTHADNSAACDDGLFCNGADTCAAGTCSVHAGDPCTAGRECNETGDVCDPGQCVLVDLPASVRCRSGRSCSVPISLDGSGNSVVSMSGSLSATIPTTCDPACVAGAAAGDADCAVTDAGTCSFDVVANDPPNIPFTTGEAAELTVTCDGSGVGEVCLSGVQAGLTDSSSMPACAEACVPFDCADCLIGDCNANGSLDAGDPVCTVLCLIGTPPPGADCFCASDCNCINDLEASDPVCVVLRLIGSFSPDTCEAPPPVIMIAGEYPAAEPQVDLRIGRPRARRNGHGNKSVVRLRGEACDEAAILRLSITAETGIGNIRLAPRLRDAGYTVHVGKPDGNNAVVVVMPPVDSVPIRGIRKGRVLRIGLPGENPQPLATGIQFGSKPGYPLLGTASTAPSK